MSLPAVEDFLLPVVMFAFSMSATPGPNNLMLTASGASFGFRRTVPHMLGISVGFFSLIAVVALGLGSVFLRFPEVQLGLRVAGSIYLLYLAWRIASRPPPARVLGDPGQGCERPFTFLEAAAFQYANPKAWVMAISAISAFTLTGEAYAPSAAAVAVLCSLVNLPSISLWAGFGVAIGRLLHSPAAWRWFNGIMGALTAACVWLILFR